MNWYWWVLIGIAGFIVVSTVFLYIYLRYFAPPGSLAARKGTAESINLSIWDKILFVIFWPELWLLEKFLDKIFEDC
jgi:hypothetical protein